MAWPDIPPTQTDAIPTLFAAQIWPVTADDRMDGLKAARLQSNGAGEGLGESGGAGNTSFVGKFRNSGNMGGQVCAGRCVVVCTHSSAATGAAMWGPQRRRASSWIEMRTHGIIVPVPGSWAQLG